MRAMKSQTDKDLLRRAARVLNVKATAIPADQKVTSQQAEEITGISIKSIQRYAKNGKLDGVEYFGRVLMIPLDSLSGLERGKPGRKVEEPARRTRSRTRTAPAFV
jgi:hypothetical protein